MTSLSIYCTQLSVVTKRVQPNHWNPRMTRSDMCSLYTDPDPAESSSGSRSSRIQFRIRIQQNPVQDPDPAESSSGSSSSRIQFRIQIQQNPVPDQIATAKNHLKHLVQLSKSAIKSPDPFPKAYPFISIHIHSYPFISIHIHSYLIVQH